MSHTFAIRSLGAGAVITSLVFAAILSRPVLANPPVREIRAFAPPGPHRPAAAMRRGAAGRYPAFDSTPTGCTSNYDMSGEFFVGIAGENDFAGGPFTGVLAGTGNEACDQYSVIGGGSMNVIGDNGHSQFSFVGAGFNNAVTGSEAFAGAGADNEAAGDLSFLGSGTYGTAEADGSFVGAGGDEYSENNSAAAAGGGNTADGIDSFIGAGDVNQIARAGTGSFIGAGGSVAAQTGATLSNSISGPDSFIGAGDNNSVSATEAFVGAGQGNAAAGDYASIGGGFGNSAKGRFSAIPGGYGNAAPAELSFAAGYHADATQAGSFVWSDFEAGSALLKSAKPNQFLARASGGVFFYSNRLLKKAA